MIHDPELLDHLDALPKETFGGKVFRGTRQSLDPLASSYSGGRWMRRDGAGVLYTSLAREGALAEISFHWGHGRHLFLARLRWLRALFDARLCVCLGLRGWGGAGWLMIEAGAGGAPASARVILDAANSPRLGEVARQHNRAGIFRRTNVP